MSDDNKKTTTSRLLFLTSMVLLLGGSLMPAFAYEPSNANVANQKSTSKKPNFVFFFADDLSKNDIGAYGNAAVRTPNVDSLAEQGLKFLDAYTSMSTCAPSRSAMLTGLYPVRNGVFVNHASMHPDSPRLPQRLRDAGYRVFLHGKQHFNIEGMGGGEVAEAFGFERIPLQHWVDGRTYLLDFGNVEKALRECKDKGEPFFLFVASGNPHAPHPEETDFRPEDIVVHPNKIDTQRFREAYTRYYQDIVNLDDEVGQCLNVIQKLGLEEDTVFVFSSDHGNTMFAKWTCYEEGLNVPLIVRWPGKIKPGETRAMVDLIDLLPTFLDIAGAPAVENIDGRTFAKVLRGEQDRHRDYLFGIHNNRGNVRNFAWLEKKNPDYTYPIRSVRDGRYKLIENLNPSELFHSWMTGASTSADDLKDPEQFVGSWRDAARENPALKDRVKMMQKRPAIEFYDLQEDPFELKNLAEDAGQSERIAAMQEELKRWMQSQGDEGIATEQLAGWDKAKGGGDN
jgi:uncharacterized sulfatase